MKKYLNKMKDENKILIMLAFFSISHGLWENFVQLWLQTNQFNVDKISQILSIATFLCAISILFVGKKVNTKNIQRFVLYALLIKTINMIVMFCTNNTSLHTIMQISVVVDIILKSLIVNSIYPMISTIKREDNLFSKKKLVEYLFKDIGILIGGFLLGKIVFGYIVDYNICLLISVLFSAISFITLLNIKRNTNQEKEKIDKKINIIQYIKSRKTIQIYLLYITFGNIAMSTGLGLKMLMFTNIFQFSPSIATNYLLIIGLIADLIGILALKYFTPKDDYLTVFIKFGLRMMGYIIAFFTNNLIVCLVAITWSILISTSYENIIDGRYINTIPKEYQLPFNNVTYIVKMIASSVGLFFAGFTYNYGIRYMLGLSAFFIFFQITFSNTLIYMKKHPQKEELLLEEE